MKRLVFLIVLLLPALAFGRGFGDFGSNDFATSFPADGVLGSGSSTDEALPRWDGTTGTLLQDSGVTLSDSSVMGGVTQLAIGGTTPNGDAALDIQGTDKVLLVSRLSTVDQTGLTPLDGMMHYDTTTGKFAFRESGVWVEIPAGGGGDFVGPAGAVSGNLVDFGDGTGKLGADSGVLAANVVTNTGASVDANVASFSGVTGKLVTDSGVAVSTLGDFVGPAGSTSGNLVEFGSGTGKLGADSGVLASNVVTNVGASVNANVATFSGVTGKLITDSALASSNVALLNGGNTFTGTANIFNNGTSMVDSNITNVGDIALDTISSDASSSVSVVLAGGAGDDFIVDTDVFVLESDSDQIGLGTTDPRTQLHVLSSGNPTTPAADINVYLQASDTINTDNYAFIASGGLGVAGWYLGDNGGPDASILYDNSARDILFSAGGLTEQMRLTNGGTLGIGETNPTARIVAKDGGAQAILGADSVAIFQNSALAADSVSIQLFSGNTGANSIFFGDTNSAVSGRLVYDHSTDDVTWTLGGGARLLFTGLGSAISDASVVALNTQTVLDLQSSTRALGMPSLTTGNRDSISATPDEGLLVWNLSTQRLEVCDSTGTTACWNAVAASPGTEGLASFGRLYNFDTNPAGQTADTTGDATLFDWSAGIVDGNGIITSTGVAPDLQLTVGTGGAGTYKIRGTVTMGASVIGNGEAYVMEIFNNGVLIPTAQGASSTQGASIITIEVDMIAVLAEGDDIDLRMRVTIGTETVTITTASMVMNRIEI